MTNEPKNASRRKLGRLMALAGAAGVAALSYPRRLLADTATTRSGLLGQHADNTSGTINPLNLRNLDVTLMGPPVTLTPVAGAVTWPLATAPIATITITQNTTITVTGGEDGMSIYRLAVIQGGAGSFTPTFSGVTMVATPVWNTAPASINRVYVDCVGTTLMADVRDYTVAAAIAAPGTVAAAGTTQGGATALSTVFNVVTSGTGGVILAGSGIATQTVVNRLAVAINVYPNSGAHIEGLGTNVATVLQPGTSATFYATSSTQIYGAG
jgi:hypothetical protein